MEALLALSPVRRLLAAAGTILVALGLGGILWQYTPIIGPHATISRLRDQVSDLSGQLKSSDAYGKNREDARKRCEDARKGSRDAEAQKIPEAAQRASLSRTDAFNSGFAAGKVAGRSSCPKVPANAPSPADPAPAVPGGLQGPDAAAGFNAGLYRPG